jgi:hypothetical protein
MEDNTKQIEALLEKATDFAKTSLELAKLKALEKTSDVVSSIIPHSVFLVLLASFLIFLNFGFAFWLGEILGEIYFGFFVIAGFYGITGFIIHFFMHKKLKKLVADYIIRQLIK